MAHLGLPRELLPCEYALEHIGVHSRWLVNTGRLHSSSSTTFARARKVIGSYFDLPDPLALYGHVTSSAPLLFKYVVDLARNNGWDFWLLAFAKCVESTVPALELLCYSRILNIARDVAETGWFNHDALLYAFLGRAALSVLSHVIDFASESSERRINARFSANVQSLILRIHCKLDDDALSLPEVRRQLQVLRSLGGGTSFASVFNPIAVLNIVNVALALSLEVGVIFWKMNPSNRWIILLSGAFLLLENMQSWSGHEVLEHVETTHNGWLRLQNLFKLGTSSSFRREVNNLGLQDFILEESDQLQRSFSTFSTLPVLTTSSFSTSRSQLRSSGLRPGFPSLSLRRFLLELERPITYSIFILVAAAQRRDQLSPTAPYVAFGDVAVLENATRNLHYRFVALKSNMAEVERGLESIRALYDGAELERRYGGRSGRDYRTAHATRGVQTLSGMAVEFRNVTLRYDECSAPALDDVSFKIEPGELVSIVGYNGCGKTSLISLLARTERQYEGTIIINGHDIRSYDQKQLAQAMSFTFQSSPVLPFTIEEYVALGSVSHKHDRTLLESALKASGADQVVASLSDGISTYPSHSGDSSQSDPWALFESSWDLPRVSLGPVGPPVLSLRDDCGQDLMFSWLSDDDSTKVGSGRNSPPQKEAMPIPTIRPEPSRDYPIRLDGQPANISFPLHSPTPRVLSGGQFQRLALAQAFFKPTTDLLVLDEPGASLDPAAEAKVFEAIASRRGSATVLFSTHRFGLTSKVDKILMFDAGKLVESGTHEELMTCETGRYRALWEVQAKGFER